MHIAADTLDVRKNGLAPAPVQAFRTAFRRSETECSCRGQRHHIRRRSQQYCQRGMRPPTRASSYSIGRHASNDHQRNRDRALCLCLRQPLGRSIRAAARFRAAAVESLAPCRDGPRNRYSPPGTVHPIIFPSLRSKHFGSQATQEALALWRQAWSVMRQPTAPLPCCAAPASKYASGDSRSPHNRQARLESCLQGPRCQRGLPPSYLPASETPATETQRAT